MNKSDAPIRTKSSSTEPVGYNKYGQKIGSKGERTRQALINATVQLLESQGLRDVSVADVAREAQTSPATFYVYFRGVPEVVLAALENASQTSTEIEELIARDWSGSGTENPARSFVDLYCSLWNQNRTVFRVRNMAAEEGDDRFYQARMDAARPIMAALASKIERAQLAGTVPAELKARSCAGTILMMLERLAAIGPYTIEDEELSYDALCAAAAYTIANMVSDGE